VPKHARGTANIGKKTSSAKLIMQAITDAYESIVDRNLLVRRINITACRILPENAVEEINEPEQLTFFEDFEEKERREETEKNELERERRMQDALVNIRHKYGKNAILKGMNFIEGATAKDRNRQIGGHKA
jgi:DNA polymerase V